MYFSAETAWSHVFKVLQPFKVRCCDSPCVAKNIWKELDSFLKKNLLSLNCCRTVGCLYNEFSVEPVSVVFVDSFFESSRDKEVAKCVDTYHGL